MHGLPAYRALFAVKRVRTHEESTPGDPNHGFPVRSLQCNARLHIAAARRALAFCEFFNRCCIGILRKRFPYRHELRLARRALAQSRAVIRTGSGLLFFCSPQIPKRSGAHAALPTIARTAGLPALVLSGPP